VTLVRNTTRSILVSITQLVNYLSSFYEFSLFRAVPTTSKPEAPEADPNVSEDPPRRPQPHKTSLALTDASGGGLLN